MIPTTSRLASKVNPSRRPSSASAADVAAYFLDTSGLVKRHVRETGSGWIRSLTGTKTPHAIYLARITAVAVTSAAIWRQRYRILEVTHALLVKAMELAQTLRAASL